MYTYRPHSSSTVADKDKHATTAQNIFITGNVLQLQKQCQFKNTYEKPKQIQQQKRSLKHALRLHRVKQPDIKDDILSMGAGSLVGAHWESVNMVVNHL